MKSDQRTAVVTGASSGIGFAIAAAYLQRGFNVVGNARDGTQLEQAAEKLGSPQNLLLIEGDIADPSTSKRIFEAAIARFGKVDILINNAGIFNAKPITDYSTQELDDLINTNLKGFSMPPSKRRHTCPKTNRDTSSILQPALHCNRLPVCPPLCRF